jgi:FkbM family methyltransferase
LISNLSLVLRHLGPIGLFKAIYFAVITAIAKTIGVKTMKKKVFNYKLYLDTSDKGLSRTLFLFGRREIDHYKMLQEILEPGMQILDIGANIGYYAIMEAKVIGDSGKVTAIEPMLPNIEMLRKNLTLNSITNIEVVHGAVSKSTGTGEMFMSTHSNLHTFHRDGSAIEYLDATPVEVPTMTLADAASKSDNEVDLIRMDVEGHEVEILGQLVDLVKNDVITPRVIFETHLTRYKKENDFVPVLQNLFSLGYSVRSAASSNPAGTARITALGYKGSEPFYSDFGERSIFDNLGNDHAIDLICNTGGLRTVLLEKTG